MELTGKIIKGIAGFYYVNCEDDGTLHTYECKAKGGFRKDKIKPLVGDNVRIQVVSKEENWEYRRSFTSEESFDTAGSGKCRSGSCVICHG